MTTGQLRSTVTEAEYLALPETVQRMELIDGEVMMPPAPTRHHQRVSARLFRALDAWTLAHPPHETLMAPLDLRLGAGRIVQPDVLVFATPGPVEIGPITQLPILVVEVMSTNRSYDRITKRHLYADARIPEYWIVDAEDASVEVVAGLNTVATFKATLTSVALKGLTLDVATLFAGP